MSPKGASINISSNLGVVLRPDFAYDSLLWYP